MDQNIGRQLGNYRLVRLLGHGGFAEVYLGEHVRLDMKAAVKLLHANLAGDEIEVFQQEAQIIAKLDHPNIIRVLDFDVQDKTPFLILDYAPNGSLREKYPRGRPVPLPLIVQYVQQVASALQYAHDHKLIHRDVKPENMLIGKQGEVRLSDFGIAAVAHSTSSMHTESTTGTLAYIAPEQIYGKPRPASDQYALAITVYQWLSGELPFQGSSTEVIAQHLAATPPPLRSKDPSISPELEQVVMTALAKDPKDRFANVEAFATALTQVCGLKSVPLEAPQPARPSAVAASPMLSPQESPAFDIPKYQQPVYFDMSVLAQPSSTFDGRDLSMPGGEPAASSLAHLLPTQELPVISSSPSQPTTMARSLEMRGAGQLRGIRAFVSRWRKVGLVALALLVIIGGLTAYLALSVRSTAQRHVTVNALATTQVRLTATAQAAVQAKATANAQIIATAQAQGKPQLLWTFAAGSLIRSSPTVVNGIVYVGSDDGKLFAINSVTGQQEWTFVTRGQINSRPTVVNGVVYVGSADSNLYAIDAMTGREKWAFPTGSGVSASPMVVDGTVYISSGSGKLFAIDTTTGQQKWVFMAGGPFWGSLIVANGVVYAGSTDHSLYAIDAATGQKKWAFTIGNSIAVSPAIANGVVYVGSLDSRLYAIDATTGQQKWVFVTDDAIWSAPTVANGVVYVGSNDHNLYAINAANGQQRWAFPTGDAVWSAPTVVNGVVYVGSMDHKVYAIDTTGQQKWAFLTGDAIQFSSPIVVNGVLYIGSTDHKLYAIAIG